MDLAVQYGPEPDQVADVVLPLDTPSAPLVLVLHGGYWRVDIDRDYLEPFVRALGAEGFAAANVEFRRIGGGGGWPATFTDVGLAVDELPGLIDAARPGRIDPARVVVLGHSSGGALALWTAHRPGRKLAGVVALAPMTDLVGAHRSGSAEAVEGLLGGSPDAVPERYAEVDPLVLGAADVPVAVVHGGRDTAVAAELSRAYASATGAELVIADAAGHLDVVTPGGPAWPSLVDTLTRLSA